MSKVYFTQYIDDLDKISKEARAKIEAAEKTFADVKEKAGQAIRQFPIGHDKRTRAEIDLREATENYSRSILEIQAEAETKVKDTRSSLVKHLETWAEAKPEMVDNNAVTLLSSGALSAADLIALANKNWNNPTMLKLIRAQAQKTNDRLSAALDKEIRDFLSPTRRMRLFDDTATIIAKTYQTDTNIALKMGAVWDEQFCDSARSHMAALEAFQM